ncbi:hypothetical protein AAG570_009914 [Ranatra chinensis]|uniref:Ciliogenesis-associated TTC17-interacting protein N-terminal domain-containing protein n=1 Tax=Ranatra chinensis TaxID=642074 RepID=A0ABD0Z7K3_9HEMI
MEDISLDLLRGCCHQKSPAPRARNLLPALEQFTLTEEDMCKLGFDEHLLILDRVKCTVGELRINVETSRDAVYVAASSNHAQGGALYAMATTSLIGYDFNTVLERRSQSKTKDSKQHHQSLISVRKGSEYFMSSAVQLETTQPNQSDWTLPLEQMEGFVSESANILLMRKLTAAGFSGTFDATLFSISGDRAAASYKVCEPATVLRGGQQLRVTKIRRRIVFESGVRVSAYAYLTDLGQLIKMWWSDSDHTALINPAAVLSAVRVLSPEESIPFSATLDTDGPMKYLFDNQVRKKLFQYKSFMADHPEAEGLLYDFINGILIYKPTDVMSYAIKYFRDII